MCATCGCSEESQVVLTNLQTGKTQFVSEHGHDHVHDHDHVHVHVHDHVHDHDHSPHSEVISLEKKILAKNDFVAVKNRMWFRDRGILALNLVSSPGAGKTTLLERTICDLRPEIPIAVIEGDQQTTNDAKRIEAAGAPVVQVNTGTACHLDAEMVARAESELDPAPNSVLFIENVGNLVCPALFNLGEWAKVAIISVTEGEDKPLKYPHIFQASELVLLNKIDLLPYVSFDVDKCMEYARQVNPHIQILKLSASRGDGLSAWYGWIREQRVILERTSSPTGVMP